MRLSKQIFFSRILSNKLIWRRKRSNKKQQTKTFSPSQYHQFFLIVLHGNVTTSSLTTFCFLCFAFEKFMCSDHSGCPGPAQGCSVLSSSICTMKGKYNVINPQAEILPFTFQEEGLPSQSVSVTLLFRSAVKLKNKIKKIKKNNKKKRERERFIQDKCSQITGPRGKQQFCNAS